MADIDTASSTRIIKGVSEFNQTLRSNASWGTGSTGQQNIGDDTPIRELEQGRIKDKWTGLWHRNREVSNGEEEKGCQVVHCMTTTPHNLSCEVSSLE